MAQPKTVKVWIRGVAFFAVWASFTFIFNGIPLEAKRRHLSSQMPRSDIAQNVNEKVSANIRQYNYLWYPDIFVYVVAVCVATITSLLVNRRRETLENTVRALVIAADIVLMLLAMSAYTDNIDAKYLSLADAEYAKNLLIPAAIAAIAGVLPEHIAASKRNRLNFNG